MLLVSSIIVAVVSPGSVAGERNPILPNPNAYVVCGLGVEVPYANADLGVALATLVVLASRLTSPATHCCAERWIARAITSPATSGYRLVDALMHLPAECC